MYKQNVEIKEVLELAEKKMPEFDTIIDLFDMTFVFISAESARLSGYTPKEMIGRHISNFMTTPDKTEEFRQIIKKTREDKVVTIPIKTKSGKELPVQMNFATIEIKEFPFLVTKAAKD